MCVCESVLESEYVGVCLCLCVCVRVKEREKENIEYSCSRHVASRNLLCGLCA